MRCIPRLAPHCVRRDRQFGADGHAIRVAAESQDRQKNHLFEFPQICGRRHLNCIVVQIKKPIKAWPGEVDPRLDQQGRQPAEARSEVGHRGVYGSKALQALRTPSIKRPNRGSLRRLARNGSYCPSHGALMIPNRRALDEVNRRIGLIHQREAIPAHQAKISSHSAAARSSAS